MFIISVLETKNGNFAKVCDKIFRYRRLPQYSAEIFHYTIDEQGLQRVVSNVKGDDYELARNRVQLTVKQSGKAHTLFEHSAP